MKKEAIYVLLAYLAIAFFVYRDCFDIFIPGDTYSFLRMFEADGVSSLIKIAKEGAPYFVAYPILYFLYQLFSIEPAYWMFTALIFHTLNSFLVFLIVSSLRKIIFQESGILVSFFSGLIFLISPYQSEEVLWTAINIRWLFHASVTLAGIYFALKFFNAPSLKILLVVQLLFFLGLFSYEFTFVCPAIYIAFYILFYKVNSSDLKPKTFFMQLIMPQVLFISGYFLVCKIVSGHWLWHAGSIGDIVQSTDYAKTLLKYFIKFIFFYRYLPLGEIDGILRSYSESKLLTLLTIIAVFAIAILLIWRYVQINKKMTYLLTTFLACFIVSILPVLPLDSSFLKYIYPDRYGYLPSAFFYPLLVFSIHLLFKKITLLILSCYSLLCWMLLTQTIPVWKASNDHCNSLIQNFKPFMNYEKVYVLNIPTYYNGTAAFRSAFSETIYMKNSSAFENIRVISGCYQESAEDTITSVIREGNSVTVQGPKKKTPFFSTNGGWAKSYEIEEFKVVFDPSGCSYTLIFKQEIPTNSAFIYTSLGSWKKAG